MPDADSFRCPTCHARQAPSPECRRCKCDLTLLVSALQRCERLHEECLRAIAGGDLETAERVAVQRWELAPDKDATRLLSVTYLLQGRFQAALDISEID
ncbi:MAG: hypothetical protein WD070_07230 [Pirellulaceae bacterium]